MKTLTEGQWLRHSRYGVGVTTQSTEARTTIDFEEHGPKTFVTEMLEAELIADPAPGAVRPRRRRKAATPKA